MLILAASQASAATLDVGAGQTYSTVEEAVAQTQSGDEILIHEGTYTEHIVLDQGSISFRGVGSGEVVLRGDDENNGLFDIEGGTVDISDVTLNGRDEDRSIHVRNGAQVTVTRVLTKNGYRSSGGGVIQLDDGTLTVVDSVFGSTVVCDVLDTDEDCDGTADDADPDVVGRFTWCLDSDGDGYGDPNNAEIACEAPVTGTLQCGDCNDDTVQVNPEATEVCDLMDTDEDCDGLADNADPDGG
ncbi:MAG: hypothetical protein JRI25_09195 [Deltaproteobacteria bacterium]|nr:hypothetical protein [Deltaproteobacteria bacterium]